MAEQTKKRDAWHGGDRRSVLVFGVSGRRYGVYAAEVIELLRAVTSEPLPNAPDIVEGVINIRGNLAAVLDIRSRFGLAAKPPEHTDHFVVAWAGERRVVLRTDRVIDLIQLDSAALVDTHNILPGVEFISRVAKLPEGLLLIHDLRTFLSHDESVAVEDAIHRAEHSEPVGQSI